LHSDGYWITYGKADFGTGSETVEFNAAAIADGGGLIELHDGIADGPILGTVEITPTGDWKTRQTFTAKIKKTSGVKMLTIVLRSKTAGETNNRTKVEGGNTTIYARFPGIKDPNDGSVEVCARATVFTPAKPNINYITVRGFDIRNVATNWAAPTTGQQGAVTAYWNKGWIIEDNEISYSRCCGIALGKYSEEWHDKSIAPHDYTRLVIEAYDLASWNKATIGSHLVRNNKIHHCGQTGIVGSLGCAFSRIIGNEIHDTNRQGIWGGAEMAGIKFHGAIDTVIADNHIHHCGDLGGLWLDWMAQGTIVTGNLFHDNPQDLFTEVNHGPFLVANNLFLSGVMQKNGWGGSQGGAYAHNFITGSIVRFYPDGRKTPVFKPHSTDGNTDRGNPVGDVRWYNNLLAGRANTACHDSASLPCAYGGNVFTKGTVQSKFEKEFLAKPEFDTGAKLIQKPDGWYLQLKTDAAWASEQKRKLVTTQLLGKAVVPDQAFENPN
ncbi:MAG TPA: carbohydrate-binding protein, partial [Luteolibacter sp.]